MITIFHVFIISIVVFLCLIMISTKLKETEPSDAIKIKEKERSNHYGFNTNFALTLCIVGFVGLMLAIVPELIKDMRNCEDKNSDNRTCVSNKPKYVTVFGNKALGHVNAVLQRIGYENVANDSTDWDVMWAFGWPYYKQHEHITKNLKPLQRINHFPGIYFLTNKAILTELESPYMLKTFNMPKQKAAFLEYVEKNKKEMFIEKSKHHRGVRLKNVSEINLDSEVLVQEYLTNPLLVDGYKFDIGVYTVITSLDPLRMYYYSGDALMRYCQDKYHPLDPKNLRQYVTTDIYQPTWQMKALHTAFHELGFGLKDSFDIYMRSQGVDPSKIWEGVHNAIRDVVLRRQGSMANVKNTSGSFHPRRPFFELVRVDLMVDEDFKVYVLEVNLSPNLVSPNPPNQLLYDQVLYSTMGLAGLTIPQYNHPPEFGSYDCMYGDHVCIEKKAVSMMLSAEKNIAVYGDQCLSSCENVCGGVCALCRTCLSPKVRTHLLLAYREHIHRGDFKRLFPPLLIPDKPLGNNLKNLSEMDRLMYMWYQGKCNDDVAWCA